MEELIIVTLEDLAKELAEACTRPKNTRFNNMAMMRALNAQPMMEIVNKVNALEATEAYLGVLGVLTRARLGHDIDIIPEDKTMLTYNGFQIALSECKKYLLTVNS